MPRAVKTVSDVFIASAEMIDCPRRAFVHYVDDEGPVPEWRLTDNWDRSMYALVYREGRWYRRLCWQGSDHPIDGGTEEAVAAAKLFFLE
jgi:hypothetical protein